MKKLVTTGLGEPLGSDIPLKSHNSLYSAYCTLLAMIHAKAI